MEILIPSPDTSTLQSALIWKHGLYSQQAGLKSKKKENLNKEADTHRLQEDHAKGHREVAFWRWDQTGQWQGSLPTGVGIPDTVSSWKQRVSHTTEPTPSPCLGRCQHLAPGLPVCITVNNKVLWFESAQLVVLCCDSPLNINAAIFFLRRNTQLIEENSVRTAGPPVSEKVEPGVGRTVA